MKLALFIDGKLTGWSQAGRRNSRSVSDLARESWALATVRQDLFAANMTAKWHFMRPGNDQNPFESNFSDKVVFSLIAHFDSLKAPEYFPVRMCRELPRKLLLGIGYFAVSQA